MESLGKFTTGITTGSFDVSISGFNVSISGSYCRPEYATVSLIKPVNLMSDSLARVRKVANAVVFKEAWKCVAEVLNRLLYNKLIMEAQFSQWVSRLTPNVS